MGSGVQIHPPPHTLMVQTRGCSREVAVGPITCSAGYSGARIRGSEAVNPETGHLVPETERDAEFLQDRVFFRVRHTSAPPIPGNRTLILTEQPGGVSGSRSCSADG